MRTPLAALAILLALAGCRKGPDLVGRWNAVAGDKTIEVEFKPDGAYAIGTSKMKAKGEYKLDGDRLTLTPKDVEMPGFPAGEMARVKAALARVPPTETRIRFTGDDAISISGLPGSKGPGKADAPAVDLKRVKG